MDRGSVTKKNHLPSLCILKKKEKSLDWATEIFYFTNNLNVNVQNKNLACTNKIYKTITYFFCSRLLSFGFDWQDKTRPSTCNIRHYINIKGEKTP